MRLFSTEQVSKYHPDKYADQISDAIIDKLELLTWDYEMVAEGCHFRFNNDWQFLARVLQGGVYEIEV